MLDGVIKHPGLAGQPLARFGPNTEAAVRWHDQWQMHRQPRVGYAGVRRDVSARLENREERSRAAASDIALRHLCEKRRRARATRQVTGLRDALIP